eukprot:GHRR01000076.1.p1 GENE.GHRR01000076.1~~GHRR01000076.1.p1  ORF type:complete len:396 (+),score=164.29 GHRR01000076.1:1422-2609(+)
MLRRAAVQCCTLQGPIGQALLAQQTAGSFLHAQQAAGTQQQAWQLTVARMFSPLSVEGSQNGQQQVPRSMLDSSLPHQGAAGQVLSGAAAARIRALQEAEPAVAGQAAAGPTVLRRVFSWLFDTTIIAALGSAVVGGYYYYRYSIPEVQQMLKELQQQQDPSLSDQIKEKALESYLQVAVPLDQKVREYTDPTCDSLLPELAPQLRGHVKTLVLDLEDVLVHKEWSRAKGWQVLKRPGVEAFLLEMGRRYEVVVYTDEPAMYADPVINKIDPHRAIQYRLYRQDTQYVNGKHVRDLSKLNRDLSQVLFVSANPAAYAFQPENTLKLKPWNHSSADTALLDLIPFLQMVQEVAVQDVRDVVRSYDGEDDAAAAFKQRMAQLAQSKKGGGGRFRLQG